MASCDRVNKDLVGEHNCKENYHNWALITFATAYHNLIVISDSKQKEVIDESSELIQNEFVVTEEQPLACLDKQEIETLGSIGWIYIFFFQRKKGEPPTHVAETLRSK